MRFKSRAGTVLLLKPFVEPVLCLAATRRIFRFFAGNFAERFSEKWNYETASIPDADIAKRMVLYRPQNTHQRPSDSLLLKLKVLMEYTPGYVALSINNSQMDIFIRSRFLSRAVSVSQKPSEQLLNFEPFPELSYIIDLARSVSR